VRHSFTHFDLVLEIWAAEAQKNPKACQGNFIFMKDLHSYALPSLMQKAISLCVKKEGA
jgi:adenine-specific DNA glycosylase